MVFAIVPAAAPAWKNQRATSWPAPISTMVPYFRGSRLIASAFSIVPGTLSALVYSICVVRSVTAIATGTSYAFTGRLYQVCDGVVDATDRQWGHPWGAPVGFRWD